MNAKRFKVIFSKRRNALVVVGENASSVTKAAGTSDATSASLKSGLQSFVGALSSIFLAVSCAYAEPTGGEFVAGAGAIATAGALTTIHQTTQQAIVNWQSFSSDVGETIQFVQPNANAAILNRVVGSLPSELNGNLIGNGHVYLINQNGIMLGKDGMINVHGNFVGSTRDVTNEAFMAGGALVFKGESVGDIQILGKVKSEAGDIVLIAPKINITQGAELVAGEKVQLVAANEVQLTNGKITIKPSTNDQGQITVEGAVQAAQVQLLASNNNLGALAINTTGTIRATGTQTNPDGSVSIIATGIGGNINLSGKIRSEKGDGNGGAVTVLADNAIRVSGTIDANSTDATKKGGDIIIGRDIVTGKLAKATDVSGATLLSNKGFVETSGDWLATDGVSVKASEWLLDPSDITISSATSSNVTGTSPADITPNGGVGTSSIVQVSTIQNSINAGTNVTIKTTNSSNTTGAGNITIANALAFKNTGATDATLSLIADNGITQNTGATITTDLVNSTKLVNVSMEAKGNYQGSTVESNNSKGITLNSTITTNGTVTLTGTSKDTTGVQTVTPYNYGVTNNSRSGVVFNNGSGITADNYQVTGTHTVAAGNSFGVNGVYMNGAVSFKAMGNTDSNITGNSNAQGNFGAGLMVMDGATIRLENQGTGVTTLKGSNTNTGGGNGVRIGAMNNSAVINAIGRVTLGQQAAGTNAPIFIRSTINASENLAKLSDLRIVGQTEKNTSAVQIWDTNINAKGVDVVVDGITANATGVYIQNSNYTTWDVKNLTVTGVANTIAGSSGSGVVVQRYAPVLTVNASGNIDIQGTVQGAGNGRGLYFAESGWGAQAPILTADGNITLRGNNRSTNNSLEAINIVSGLQARAKGNIVLQAETNKDSNTAISLFSNPISSTNWNTAGASALQGNTSLQATGNVLVQSNRGSISLNNQLSSTLTNGLTGSALMTSDTKITGNNITIDNTGAGMAIGAGNAVTGTGGTQGAAISNGGSIDANGNITAGSGKATNVGVLIADKRAITATGNLNIAGASTGAVGINTNGVLTAGGDVNLTGTSSGTNANAHGVMLTGKVNSTAGAVNITGSSAASNGGAGAIIQATVDAKNNITLDGRSGNIKDIQGLVIQEAVTSVDGNITVTGETKAGDPGQRAVAITANGTKHGSLKVKDGQAININANTLFIKDTSFVNAGSGTVNIKTLTSGNEILIGGTTANDAMSSILSSQKLGIDNTELDRITAGNLVIGDTSSTGKITVSAATTTLAQTGNITLKTAGEIAINEKLEVNANKTLTLIAGTSMTDNASGVIKTSQLELLGANAAVTLDSKKHEVGTLAADVKSLSFANKSALTVGDVTTINSATGGTKGINAQNDIKVTTQTGDLTVSEKIETTAGTSTAVLLNAGELTAAGTNTGGDIVVGTNGSVVVSNGGTAQLMSGSISGTTGIGAIAASGSGKFRYGSDESAPNYSKALDTKSATNNGVNIIYREKPMIAIKVSDVTKVYDGVAYSGGSFVSTPTAGSLQNGDTVALVTENAKFSGDAQGIKNVRDVGAGKPIIASDTKTTLTSVNALGYGVTYETGTLKITPKDVTVAAAGNTVVFNSQQQTDGIIPNSGFINGDNVVITGLGTGVQAGSYTSNLQVAGDDVTNYNVTTKNAVFTISAQTYVRPPVETTILTPVSFGLAYAGGVTAAGGDGVDISSACDAWSQRAGAGSISVMTLLKPNTMGLRTAKTDTMDAMTGGSVASSVADAGESPCGSAGLANKQAGL